MKVHHYKIRPGIRAGFGYFTRGPRTPKKTRYYYTAFNGPSTFIRVWCKVRKCLVQVHMTDWPSFDDAKEVARSRAQRGFRPDLKSNRIEFVRDQIIVDGP